MNNTTEHPDWPYDDLAQECESCYSTETFETFDGKLVCRVCMHVEKLRDRPVNVITNDLVISSQPSPLDSIPLNTLLP